MAIKKNILKKGQISTEYIIVVSFIMFLIISTLGIAFFYADNISDRIKMDQVENYARKVISSSERIYYAGEPSKTTLNAFLPSGVKSIEVIDNSLIFDISTSTGANKISFTANVILDGNLSITEGTKRISLTAESNKVKISEF